MKFNQITTIKASFFYINLCLNIKMSFQENYQNISYNVIDSDSNSSSAVVDPKVIKVEAGSIKQFYRDNTDMAINDGIKTEFPEIVDTGQCKACNMIGTTNSSSMSFQDHPQFVHVVSKIEDETQPEDSNNDHDGMIMEPENASTAEEDCDELYRDQEIEIGPTEVVSQDVKNFPNDVIIPSNEVTALSEMKLSCGWTDVATKALIACYKTYRDGVGSLKLRNMKKLWDLISVKLRDQGYLYTAANCENKFRVLERNFKKYVNHDRKSGKFKRYFEYYEETKDIFGTKWSPYTNPIFESNASKPKPSTSRVQSVQTTPQIVHTSTIPMFATTSSQPSISRPASQLTQTRVLIAVPTTQVIKHPSPAIINPMPAPVAPPIAPFDNPSSPDSDQDEKSNIQKRQKTTFVRVLQKIRSDNSQYKKEKIVYLRNKARYYEEKNRKLDEILVEMKNLSHSVIRLCNALGQR